MQPTSQPSTDPQPGTVPPPVQPVPNQPPFAAPQAAQFPQTQAQTVPVQPSGSLQPHNPGKGLGIAGFVVSLVSIPFGMITLGIMSLVGLILSIVAKKKSKKAGQPNGLAVAGIIISIISLVGTLLLVGFTFLVALQARSVCNGKEPGTYTVGSTQYTCGTNGGASVNTGQ